MFKNAVKFAFFYSQVNKLRQILFGKFTAVTYFIATQNALKAKWEQEKCVEFNLGSRTKEKKVFTLLKILSEDFLKKYIYHKSENNFLNKMLHTEDMLDWLMLRKI